MNLLIYTACQKSICLDRETNVRVEWSGVEPWIGDLVSMGRGKSWEVIKKVRFSEGEAEPTGEVENKIGPIIVFVHPSCLEVPQTDRWDLFDVKEIVEAAIDKQDSSPN